MKIKGAGKIGAGLFFWAGGQAAIGFASLLLVLPSLLTATASQPGWKIISLAAGMEIISHWPPGVAAAAVFLPWVLSQILMPPIDLSVRFFAWCTMVALLQMAWLTGWEMSWRGGMEIPWLIMFGFALFSAGLVYSGAIWIHWHYPKQV